MIRTQESSPQLTRRSSAKSQNNVDSETETGRHHPTGSLEHGVHVITDGKEETVGHGYASLGTDEDQRNAQDDSSKLSATDGTADEKPVPVPKTVSFAQ